MARWPGALAAPLLLLAVGCSGSGHPSAASADAPGATSSAATGSTPAAGTRQSSSRTAPTAAAGAQGSTRGTTQGATDGSSQGPATATRSPSPQPSPSEIPLHGSLAKSCVVPGSTQTLTLHARPKMSVIFDTLYPDQKDGQAYGGIDAHGRTDVTGSYTMTWTVSAAAPVGTAKVNAAAITDDGTATGHDLLPFRISLTC